MSHIEYIVVLVSIIVGLGVTDLAESIRALLHPDRPVRWHWLPLAWIFTVLLTVVSAWWGFSLFLQGEVWRSPVAFLLLFFVTVSLYLFCAFALPDLEGAPTEESPKIDLKAFYFSASHRHAFFGVALSFTLLFWGAVGLWKATAMEVPAVDVAQTMLINALYYAIPYSFLLSTKRTWVHVILTLVVFGLTVWLFVEMGPLLATE